MDPEGTCPECTIPALHHKNVIGGQLLEVYADGDDIHCPALGLCHLLKTENDIMSELIRGVIVHIFYQYAELF